MGENKGRFKSPNYDEATGAGTSREGAWGAGNMQRTDLDSGRHLNDAGNLQSAEQTVEGTGLWSGGSRQSGQPDQSRGGAAQQQNAAEGNLQGGDPGNERAPGVIPQQARKQAKP